MDARKRLDGHYIPDPYPNSVPEGAPRDYYTTYGAQAATENPDKIVASVKTTCLDKAGGQEALGRYVAAQAAGRRGVRRILPAASFARGAAVPGRAGDDVIAAAESALTFGDGAQNYPPRGWPVAMNVFPYAEIAADAMPAQGNRFIPRALAAGTVRHSEGEA